MNQFFQNGIAQLDYLGSFIPYFSQHAFRPWIMFICLLSMLGGGIWSLSLVLKAFFLDDPVEKRERAETLARKGRYREAKALFIEVQAYARAAEMAIELRRPEEAGQLARKSGNQELLAKILIGLERFEEAALAFDRARLHGNAGVYYERVGKLDLALDRFRKANHLRKVEELLHTLERHEELGDFHAREFERRRAQLGEGSTAEQEEKVRSFATRAANAYRQANQFRKAFELYMKSNQILEAARCMEECGESVRAADLYLQAGKGEEAARLLIRAGQFDRAADVYEEMGRSDEVPKLLELAGRKDEAKAFAARLALEQGDEEKAAQLYAEAGEGEAAAKLFAQLGKVKEAGHWFEKIGNFTEAAQAYAQAEEPSKAAPLFARMGHHAQAADAYEKCGQMELAVEEYAKAGQFFDAGRLTEAHLDPQQAIPYFQRVPQGAPESEAALHALARLFWRLGKVELANEKFQKACEGKILDRTNLDIFYDYATFLEGSGNLKKASEIFEDILAMDFHFKDVVSRVDGIVKRLRGNKPSKPSPPPDPEDDLFIPKPGAVVTERYELGKEIGRGAMGVIFHAQDRKLGREVAVKFLVENSTETISDENAVLQEAKLAAQLSHPHIVAMYDAGKYRGRVYLVMEYVDGPNLAKWLRNKKKFTWPETKTLLSQTVDALAYAHEHQVVHRDIKTANLLVTTKGQIKISDFGLARLLREGQMKATQTVGSPYYMAPEQIRGDDYDHRVDIYALGIVAFEMLTGTLPFLEGEVTYHHLHTPAPLASSRETGVSEAIDQWLMKILEKKPEDRFQTADEVKLALEQIQA